MSGKKTPAQIRAARLARVEIAKQRTTALKPVTTETKVDPAAKITVDPNEQINQIKLFTFPTMPTTGDNLTIDQILGKLSIETFKKMAFFVNAAQDKVDKKNISYLIQFAFANVVNGAIGFETVFPFIKSEEGEDNKIMNAKMRDIFPTGALTRPFFKKICESIKNMIKDSDFIKKTPMYIEYGELYPCDLFDIAHPDLGDEKL